MSYSVIQVFFKPSQIVNFAYPDNMGRFKETAIGEKLDVQAVNHFGEIVNLSFIQPDYPTVVTNYCPK